MERALSVIRQSSLISTGVAIPPLLMEVVKLMNIFSRIVFEYEPHGCEYTMDINGTLFTRHDDSEDWAVVDKEHCIAEGINHYEVYKHFGEEKWYVDFLFDYACEKGA